MAGIRALGEYRRPLLDAARSMTREDTAAFDGVLAELSDDHVAIVREHMESDGWRAELSSPVRRQIFFNRLSMRERLGRTFAEGDVESPMLDVEPADDGGEAVAPDRPTMTRAVVLGMVHSAAHSDSGGSRTPAQPRSRRAPASSPRVAISRGLGPVEGRGHRRREI